jgi:hypothetical protein
MSSETTNELNALIVSNVGDLEAAAHRLLFEVQHFVTGEMDKLVKKWVSKNKWKGDCDWSESGLWVAPPNWESDVDGWLGQFHLDFDEENTGGDSDFKADEDIFG